MRRLKLNRIQPLGEAGMVELEGFLKDSRNGFAWGFLHQNVTCNEKIEIGVSNLD